MCNGKLLICGQSHWEQAPAGVSSHRSLYLDVKIRPGQCLVASAATAASAAVIAIAAAGAVIATAVVIAAAAPDDDQQNDDTAAIAAAKVVIAHIWTSYEMLTGTPVSIHSMRPLLPGEEVFSFFYRRTPGTPVRAASHSEEVNTPWPIS